MRVSNRKRVFVNSGAGFLGSYLYERLLRDGCDVLCVNNFYSGTKDNIVRLMGNPHFELMRHDVTFPLYVEVDEIYNLFMKPLPQDDPRHQPDITFAKTQLNWESKVSLEDGIKKTVLYFKEALFNEAVCCYSML